MLGARLVVGSLLAAVTVGILLADPYLAPAYPFLFVFALTLTVGCCWELVHLLQPARLVQAPVCWGGCLVLLGSHWFLGWLKPASGPWPWLTGILAGLLAVVFLYEMASFNGAGRSVERMAYTWWLIGYLGLMPAFIYQVRWIFPDHQSDLGSVCFALAIFVPKCGDIGAFFTGKLIGRHKMTPILSPNKTWEGAAGGLTLAALAAVLIDQLAPRAVLGRNPWLEIGFGLTVGLAGMLGDLAESLIKRDCGKKDASSILPGFGGLLDVVDSVVFAAPLAYSWFILCQWRLE